MPNVGFFDPELRSESWFDDELLTFFDDEFVEVAAGADAPPPRILMAPIQGGA